MDDLRMRGSTVVDVASLPGTIHPFLGTNKSLLETFIQEMLNVLSHKQAKKIMAYTACNIVCTIMLLFWCSGTNSMALTAYTYLTIFDIFRLITCLVSLWVKQQKPTPIFSFGYERFEVLTVFASTILAQLGALFVMKESVERMLQQPEIHTGRLLVGTAVAFLFHLVVTYSMDNKAFNHIVAASTSSWLQEHVADMSESLCHLVPGLSKLLLPRINPFALIAFAGGMANIATYILIDMNNYYSADTWAAVWIAMMTLGTMFPMSVYSGKILLQTTPSHMIGQLDKVIREASTLDGVLEFRHEHFWTVAFGTLAGSVHVRVRRDADEQLVLAHVVNRLSNLISVLTVQIFKDDWTRTSAYQILGDTAILNKLPSPISSPSRSPVMDTGHGHAHGHSHAHTYNLGPQSPVGLLKNVPPPVGAGGSLSYNMANLSTIPPGFSQLGSGLNVSSYKGGAGAFKPFQTITPSSISANNHLQMPLTSTTFPKAPSAGQSVAASMMPLGGVSHSRTDFPSTLSAGTSGAPSGRLGISAASTGNSLNLSALGGTGSLQSSLKLSENPKKQ